MTISDVTAPTMRITVTGADRPGVSAGLLAGLAQHEARVVDVEQIVVQGHLTLVVLLGGVSPDDEAALAARAEQICTRLGMGCQVETGIGDAPHTRTGRVVVTLLANPLTAAHLSAVTSVLYEHGANVDRIRRISRRPVTTLELHASGVDPVRLRRVLATASVEHGFDVAVSPAGLARQGRRLVVMDVDSTLIRQEVIELLAAHAGREAEVAAVTERAMRGELDFAQSLHERVATLAGLPVGVLDEVRDAVELTPGARTLVRTLKQLGFTVAVVSGGFIEVVQPLADELGIDHAMANRLEVEDGHLTGRVLGEVVDRAGKAAALRRFAAAEGLPLSRTVAIGDGANDLDMLDVAGLGVAFNAKPAVRAQADTSITVPYLDSVLPLLGISHDDVEDAEDVAPRA